MSTTNALRLSVLVCLAAAAAFAAGDPNTTPMTVAVQGGTASFIANTNVSAISIKGKSTALEAKVNLHRSAEGLQLEHIEANMPVKSLVTGMGLRDEHMRKHIFTTADGQVPDLHFEGGNTTCSTSGKEATCQVNGTLAIRGVTRPFTIPLKIREDGASFKAAGDAVVKLSVWGIDKPTQLGVTTKDEVNLHFDFAAKSVAGDLSMAGGGK